MQSVAGMIFLLRFEQNIIRKDSRNMGQDETLNNTGLVIQCGNIRFSVV